MKSSTDLLAEKQDKSYCLRTYYI